MKIDLNDNAETKIELDNNRILKATSEKLNSDYRLRSIVRSSGGASIGKPFVKLISITDDYSNEKTLNINFDGLDEVLVRFLLLICIIFLIVILVPLVLQKDQAYNPPKQHSNLHVQSVPIGSLSTKEDIAKRGNQTVESGRPSKRQKVAFKPVESPVIKEESRHEKKDKEEKKKKKEKKHHKER